MNLRFWEWDRVYNLACIALLFAVVASVVLSIIPITVVEDAADGSETYRTIWEETSILGAVILVGLPVMITLSPLMVLSKAGGIGRQQLINLWMGFALIAVYLAVTLAAFGLAYVPAGIFSLAAAVAGTVRRDSTAIGKTAAQGSAGGRGVRLSKDARKRDRSGRKGR